MKLADGTEIPFSCTADTLADDLWRRYKASDAPRFDFADTNQLCCVPVRACTNEDIQAAAPALPCAFSLSLSLTVTLCSSPARIKRCIAA